MLITHGKPKKSRCRRCPLYKAAHLDTGFVPMEFHPTADGRIDVLLVGQGPGATEDLEGLPFQGPAGQVLRRAVKKVNDGSFEGVGFDNNPKCRPVHPKTKKNRDPLPAEMDACGGYLRSNIKRFQPKVVVLLGNVAVRGFFPKTRGITRTRGTVKRKGDVTYVFAYHPSYVARQGGDKTAEGREFRKDLRKAFKLAGRVSAAEEYEDEAGHGKSVLVTSVADVRKLVRKILRLPRGSVVACDTESRNLNRVRDNELYSIQFSFDGDVGYVIPLRHPKTPFFGKELRQVYSLLRKVFTTTRVKVRGTRRKIRRWLWLFHNANFDLHQIRREFGVEVVNNPNVDTMQIAYLLNENRLLGSRDAKDYYFPEAPRGLGLDLLVRAYLGEEYGYDGDDKADRANMVKWSLERFVEYSGQDAWKLWRLFHKLLEVAEDANYRKKLLKLAYHLYSDANLMLVEMERNGMQSDIEHLRVMLDRSASPMMLEMARMVDKLKHSKHAQRVNSRLFEKQSKGNNTLWGGTPWVISLSKDAQLRELFFNEMGLEPLSYTDTKSEKWPEGTPQVNKRFYKHYGKWDLATDEPLNEAAIVGTWVGINKLYSAFVKSIYFKFVHPDDGHPDMLHDARVRGRLRITATSSGRGAHQDPNMGQLPRADTDHRRATKNIFIAPEGRVILGSDLMANEVRWGAICSEDRVLGRLFQQGRSARRRYRKYAESLDPVTHMLFIEYLRLEKTAKFEITKKGKKQPRNPEAERLRLIASVGGKKFEKLLALRLAASLKGDIHKMTASEFFGVAVEEVTKQLRSSTKAIVFGYMYGRSIKSIAAQISRPVEDTEELCNGFDDRYPDFAHRLKTWPVEAEENYFVESPLGRRRRFHPNIWEEAPKWMRAKARRQAKNSPIQGVASDACLIAASLLYKYIRDNGLQGSWLIVNIVHDAIYLEVPYADVARAAEVMENCLTSAMMSYIEEHFGVDFVAPMECDFGMGVAWGDMRSWDFSAPHFDLVMAQVAEDHKKKWGHYPKGSKPYLRMVSQAKQLHQKEVGGNLKRRKKSRRRAA